MQLKGQLPGIWGRALTCVALLVTVLGFKESAAANSEVQAPQVTDLFVAGSAGHHTYRIPTIVTSIRGTVLAFCEGRKSSASDTGEIDIVLKRSMDGGNTWAPQQVVWADAGNVCGNPAPVVDHSTGEIWLAMTWNLGSDTEARIMAGTSTDTRRVFITRSKDDGLSWEAPREITRAVKKSHWRWYATGPVNGIQTTRGPHPGRLLFPANHSDSSDPAVHPYRAHVIYSDDDGETWVLGGIEEEKTNESTLAELADGRLMQNMRSYHNKNRRAVAFSEDAGQTWSPLKWDDALIEPVCQASLLRYSWPGRESRSRLLFANPASLKRENLTVRTSYDEGTTWAASRNIHKGPAAYSCLTVLPDQRVGCLFECGTKMPYEKIVLARFPIAWSDAGK